MLHDSLVLMCQVSQRAAFDEVLLLAARQLFRQIGLKQEFP
jgi:hypothetical protein